MEKVSEISQNNRLRQWGINIKTKYRTHAGIRERNTDQSLNQNVEDGIRIQKLYYRKGAIIHKRKNFDSRIHYTFVSDPGEDKLFTCPNCGAVSKSTESGCPYCGTFWNVEYSHKDLGTKSTYDWTMKNNSYIKATFVIDFIVCSILAWIYISATGRTFNIYDASKALVLGITLSAALFYGFYYLDALIILWPIKRYKDKLNRLQIDFWERMKLKNIGKEKFYNNFNYEVSRYFFQKQEDVIDYDILDYNSLQESEDQDGLEVCVNATVCLVSYLPGENKIREHTEKMDFHMVYRGRSRLILNGGRNRFVCRNCGSSIDVTEGKCPYCDTVYDSFQEWYLKT